MAGNVIQTKEIRSSPGSSPNGSLTAVASGSIIIVLVSFFSAGSDGAITCSGGPGTWTTRVSSNNGQNRTAICECLNPGTGTVTVTVSSSGTGDQYITAIACEVSGMLTTGTFDVSATNSSTSNAPNSGTTAATAQADELAFAAFGADASNSMATPTSPAAFTNLLLENDNSTYQPASLSWRVLSATGTQSASFSVATTSVWAGCIATYKASAGGGGGTINTKTAESDAVVIDQVLASRYLNREAADNIVVVDAVLMSRYLNREAPDIITVIDSIISSIFGSGTIYSKIATDTIDVPDSILSSLYLNREGLEGIVLTEGGTVFTSLYNITAEDTLVMIDAVAFNTLLIRAAESDIFVNDTVVMTFIRVRRLDDGIDVVDDVIVTVVRGNVTIITISADDFVTVTDGAQWWFERNAMGLDNLLTTDGSAQYFLRSALASDQLETIDEVVRIMRWYRVATSNADIIDQIQSLFVGVTLYDGSAIEIGTEQLVRIGSDQPRIELGAYNAIQLGGTLQ